MCMYCCQDCRKETGARDFPRRVWAWAPTSLIGNKSKIHYWEPKELPSCTIPLLPNYIYPTTWNFSNSPTCTCMLMRRFIKKISFISYTVLSFPKMFVLYTCVFNCHWGVGGGGGGGGDCRVSVVLNIMTVADSNKDDPWSISELIYKTKVAKKVRKNHPIFHWRLSQEQFKSCSLTSQCYLRSVSGLIPSCFKPNVMTWWHSWDNRF